MPKYQPRRKQPCTRGPRSEVKVTRVEPTPGQARVGFGKWKGSTIEQIAEQDISYIAWLSTKGKTRAGTTARSVDGSMTVIAESARAFLKAKGYSN